VGSREERELNCPKDLKRREETGFPCSWNGNDYLLRLGRKSWAVTGVIINEDGSRKAAEKIRK